MTSTTTTPTAADFPLSLSPTIHLPASSQPTNILLCLPGLGDTSANFSSFPRALNLPDTLCITLNPLFPLPFPLSPGQHWSEDLQIDSSTGTLDAEGSPLIKATGVIAKDVIADVLVGKFGYRHDHIHLFGYGQGGSLALSIPLHKSLSSGPALGSILLIGGSLPITAPLTTNPNRTPILLLSGSKSTLASPGSSPLKRLRDTYEFVTYHQWKKGEDSIPKNRDEVLPMMRFWSEKLKSRRGVPEGALEIS